MVNRYTVNVVLRKKFYPQHIVANEDILDIAIMQARFQRPRMTPDMVTDLLIGETESAYVIKVNWWPHKKGDQI